MQDPSYGVATPLLQHVHLLSTTRYPFSPQPMMPEHALEYLLQCSKIVRERAAMAWQYLTPPTDGTILLAWQPLNQLGTQYASDGYVWAEPEKQFTNEIRGHTIEISVFESGFIPALEQVAQHRRVRYRLISAPSNVPVESALEIVHYTQSFPEHRLASRSIPLSPQQQKRLQDRQYLESQGALPRKEFMLHDSPNWPSITIPAPAAATNPYQQAFAYNRGGQQGQMNAQRPGGVAYAVPPPQVRPGVAGGLEQSPAKRIRQTGPMRMFSGSGIAAYAAASAAGMAQSGIDEGMIADEENAGAGDLLDMLSPQEISVTRYTQHHEWMEEILSSPYAIRQIVPVNLGLTLAGELGELTSGLFDAPTTHQAVGDDYRAIKASQVAELEKRVNAYVMSSKRQLVEMQQAHTKKMADLKSHKRFAGYERRLAELPPLPRAGEHASQQPAQASTKIDALVAEVARETGARLDRRRQVVRVQRGGLSLGTDGTADEVEQEAANADEILEDAPERDVLEGSDRQPTDSVDIDVNVDAITQPMHADHAHSQQLDSNAAEGRVAEPATAAPIATIDNTSRQHQPETSSSAGHNAEEIAPVMSNTTEHAVEQTTISDSNITTTSAGPTQSQPAAPAPSSVLEMESLPSPSVPAQPALNTSITHQNLAESTATAPSQAQAFIPPSGDGDAMADLDAGFVDFADLDTAGEALDFYNNFPEAGPTPDYNA